MYLFKILLGINSYKGALLEFFVLKKTIGAVEERHMGVQPNCREFMQQKIPRSLCGVRRLI